MEKSEESCPPICHPFSSWLDIEDVWADDFNHLMAFRHPSRRGKNEWSLSTKINARCVDHPTVMPSSSSFPLSSSREESWLELPESAVCYGITNLLSSPKDCHTQFPLNESNVENGISQGLFIPIRKWMEIRWIVMKILFIQSQSKHEANDGMKCPFIGIKMRLFLENSAYVRKRCEEGWRVQWDRRVMRGWRQLEMWLLRDGWVDYETTGVWRLKIVMIRFLKITSFVC